MGTTLDTKIKRRWSAWIRLPALTILALVGDLVFVDSAGAQAKFNASYTISMGLLTIGSTMVSADLANGMFTISATGRTGGFVRVLASGQGSYETRGTIRDGRLVPERFSSTMRAGGEMLDVMLLLDNGNVREMIATPRFGESVPLTEAHRRGVIDPLTAMFLPARGIGGTPGSTACNGTLPIFDGYQRYDLKLSLKRVDMIDIKPAYSGPVVVCALTHEPIAGHRISDAFIRFLSGREIETALAPIASGQFLAPVRISVASMLANLVIQANQFGTNR